MRRLWFLLTILVFVSFLPLASRAWALNQAFFSLSPPDLIPRVGESFNIDITLNTDEAKVKGADAVLTFDPAKLSVVSLTPGAIFDSYPKKSFDTSGNINLSGAMAATTASFSGIGKFGTITFRGLVSGTTTVSFVCRAGGRDDTNVTQILTDADIVDCSRLSASSLSIIAAVGAPTATPTAVPSPPPAGMLEPTRFLLVFGAGLLVVGGIGCWFARGHDDPD